MSRSSYIPLWLSSLSKSKPRGSHVLSRRYSSDVKSPDFNVTKFKGMSSHFPCLDRLKEKQKTSNGGVTGMYGEKIQGYNLYEHTEPFYMKHGGVLPQLILAYEEWGQLNKERNNVILLYTGLSASSHAKSTTVRDY